MEIFVWQQRAKQNLTLVQLADITGVSKSEINAIENGKASPRLDTLERIAVGLGVNICDLYKSSITNSGKQSLPWVPISDIQEMAPGSIAARQQDIYNMGYQPGRSEERGYTMQQLRRKIIELINSIDSLEKLKIIYQFIRGLLSS